MSNTDFLIEIGAICSSFESLLQGNNRKLIQNIKELTDRARLEIKKRDDEIESLQGRIVELEGILADNDVEIASLRDTVSQYAMTIRLNEKIS